MKTETILQFAHRKNTSTQTIYNAIKAGRIGYVESEGQKKIQLNQANLLWKPGTGNGRPKQLNSKSLTYSKKGK